MKISIITPTIRHEGLQIIAKALRRQTFQDFEWIVVSPEEPEHVTPSLYLKDPEKNPGDVWTLNKSYNLAIKHASAPLIVSWQDWTFANPDVLEKFYFHYTQEPKTLISAVGNKYADDSWSVMNWKDPRERDDQGTFYPSYFSDIEWNLCSCPKQAIIDVGGFDESLDAYFGMDAYGVNDRINMLGTYDFKIDQTIKSFSLEHGRPDNWEEKNAIHGPYAEKRKHYLLNPVLSYI